MCSSDLHRPRPPPPPPPPPRAPPACAPGGTLTTGCSGPFLHRTGGPGHSCARQQQDLRAGACAASTGSGGVNREDINHPPAPPLTDLVPPRAMPAMAHPGVARMRKCRPEACCRARSHSGRGPQRQGAAQGRDAQGRCRGGTITPLLKIRFTGGSAYGPAGTGRTEGGSTHSHGAPGLEKGAGGARATPGGGGPKW